MTNSVKTMPLAKIWEEIEAWNAELDAIEQALDEAEARQAIVEERMQERISHRALSPVGVLPPKPSRGKSSPPLPVHPKANSKK